MSSAGPPENIRTSSAREMNRPQLLITLARIPPLEQAGLRVLIELIVQGLAQAKTEDFQIGMCVAHCDTLSLDGLHGVEDHCRLSCPLGAKMNEHGMFAVSINLTLGPSRTK